MTLQNIIRFIIPKIHKDGYTMIWMFCICAMILLFVSDKLGLIGIVATILCVYFFRDPCRIVPSDDSLVISPADGIVQSIARQITFPAEITNENILGTRISIFLSIFDVHVNRVPVRGMVIKSSYRPGKFINASLDKASEDNERQSLLISTTDGREIAVVQIAGLIARRIICNVHEGDQVKLGAKYGIIKFGSRVDIYLPEGIEPLVLQGQKMIGGETVLARLEGEQRKLEGIVK